MVNSSMDVQTGHVLQKLFSEGSLDNISVERLQQIVEEYPYFTLGHFLLAKKLGNISAAEFEAQSENAALYFNEPIWLQSLLHPSVNAPHVIRERAHEENENGQEHTEQVMPVEEIASEAGHHEPDEVVEQREELYSAEVSVDETFNEEVEIVEQPITDTPAPAIEGEQQNEPEAELPIAEATEQEVVAESTPIFEPYHTVDYFASQGIKISNELKPTDRLGQQLMSFTAWLKTMKRLPETQIEQQLDEVSQQNIQEFASHSLDEKEVVTESMAEVLLKQYKYAEAVSIYEKLSLLNPSKRAYFAAKIEQLKGS